MAGIRERLTVDLKDAMQAKDEIRLSTIRMARAEILYKDKEKGTEVSEDQILRILQSMIKKGEEASQQYEKGGRPELASKERAEIEIIKVYLPAQMDEEEVREEAQTVINEVGAASMKDMGKVMGILTKKLVGRASGTMVSQTVKEILGE
jgi:hypothetical protein